MDASPSPCAVRPARKIVIVVTAATLSGMLAIAALGEVVLPEQVYAAGAPLAAAPSSNAQVGGLLPIALLQGARRDHYARDLRPAALLLVQYPCDCTRKLRQVATQADGQRVKVYVVGFNGRPQIDRLAQEIGFDVVPLLDEARILERTYRPSVDGTLLLVRRDGVVSRILDDFHHQTHVSAELPALLELP